MQIDEEIAMGMSTRSIPGKGIDLGLAPHVHAVQLGDDRMLDLEAGRYLCLSGVAITTSSSIPSSRADVVTRPDA